MIRLPPVPLLLALGLALLLAGCGAALDRRADRREAAWSERHPPLGRLVQLDGRQVHVLVTGRRAGTAPDVVLIHGANGNLRDFTHDLVARLATDYRVIAVDRPGLGWSDPWPEVDDDPQAQARILRRALAGLRLERPILVGHSYGAAVALGWAIEAEAELGALVLLAGVSHPWPRILSAVYRFETRTDGAASRRLVAGLVGEGVARIVLRAVFAPDPLPPGYARDFGLGLAMRRATREANNRQVGALRTHLLRMAPHYPALRLPVEALHGTADRIVGIDLHARRLEADLPGTRLTVLDGVGHMPHHVQPQAVVAAIARAAVRAGLR